MRDDDYMKHASKKVLEPAPLMTRGGRGDRGIIRGKGLGRGRGAYIQPSEIY